MGGGEVARYLGKYGSKSCEQSRLIAAIPPFLLRRPITRTGGRRPLRGDQEGHRRGPSAFLTDFLSNFYNVDVLGGKLVSRPTGSLQLNIAVGARQGHPGLRPAWLTDFPKGSRTIDVPTCHSR